MGNFLKNLTIIGILAGLWCGGALALEYGGDSNIIAEDAARSVSATLHSRLDAFRKIREPAPQILQLNTPSTEVQGITTLSPAGGGTAEAATVDAAYGSLFAPTYEYGSRYLNRFWGGGLGSWQDMDEGDGYHGYKYDSKGVILGFDRAHGPMLFGITASYIKGEYENGGARDHDSEIKHYSGNIHFTYNNSRGFFFTALGGYTHSDNDIRETVGAAVTPNDIEDSTTHTWNAGAKVGFDFEPGSSTVITPSIGVNLFHSKSSGMSDLISYKAKHHVMEIPLDVTVAHEIAFSNSHLLQLSASGGYTYNMNDKAVRILDEVNGDEVNGRRLGRNGWHAGAGARMKIDQWDIGLKYDFYKRSHFDSHSVMGTVGFSF